MPPAMTSPPASAAAGMGDRLDVPGVITDRLLMGSVQHALDADLLKHLQVGVLLDAENPRKRAAHAQISPEPTVDVASVDLDYYSAKGGADADANAVGSEDGGGMDAFRKVVATANEVIRRAIAEQKTVFVFCTHGNNESAVVCIAYLMVAERWTLERSYRHVLQKRPASSPRKPYIDKLRALEREVHGRMTLRSDQVGPSMMDLMRGLQGQAPAAMSNDADERCSQATEAGSSTLERASIVSNMSVATGLHNGSSLRETMVIAEREEESEDGAKTRDVLLHPHLHGGSSCRKRAREQKGNCVVS